MQPIDDTSTTVLTCGHLDTDSISAFDNLAEDSENDDDDDNDSDNDEDCDDMDLGGGDGGDNVSRLVKQFRAQARDGASASGNQLHEDDAVDTLNEFVEEYEAGDASTVERSECELVRSATEECFAPDMGTDDADGDGWVATQKTETLEKERDHFELAMSTQAISAGVKLGGPEFVRIAEEAMAEP